jgi:DNA repair protein RecN (Recombination protein N)
MKAAASYLLDIHGQHEHQSLLYPDKQLDILDAYGKEKIQPAKEAVAKAYRSWRDCRKRLGELDMDEEQKNREMAFLEFEIREIENASLKPGEDEELERQYRKLGNARKIVESVQIVHQVTGYEDGQGAGDQIGNGLRELSRVLCYDPELSSFEETLREIDSLLNDFNRELSSYLDTLTFDDAEFYEIEHRLDLVNTLKSKYGSSIEAILSYQKKQQEKLDQLVKYEENLQKIQEELRISEQEFKVHAQKLTHIRKEYAEELSKKVIAGLKDLNFLDVDFGIRFTQKNSYSANGVDEVEYEISTNPGESRKPLGKIVSGGELSRIMLALKTILADRDQIETLIFDEIDTGISGRTAQKVSEKMALIGASHQVLCITHLPQIAAMADTHFEIEKHLDGQETTTQIHPLDEETSIHELARLLGGAKITPAVLENAREMKELARVHKNARLK